ncbi:MAG: amidohydrolase [Elainellaceae cyanobacterium]
MNYSYTLAQVLIPTDTGYACRDVHIADGTITAIGENLPQIGQIVDGRNRLLLPGFVNAHTHSSEMWQRGLIAPLPLELWLAVLCDFGEIEPEHIYLSALGTAVETLLSGGTTVVDHLVPIPGREMESVEAAVRAYREVGIRAFIGPLLHDEPLPASIPLGSFDKSKRAEADHYLSTVEALELAEAAIKTHHCPEDGIEIMVAPTGAQLSTDSFLEGCVELSDRHQVCRHSHLLESKAQKILAQEKYGGSMVAHLHKLGFLGDRASFAHCVWLDDDDIALMAQTGSTVVHNPLSNLRLGSGIAPLLKYRQAGVNVTFGCDGAASNDGQDVLEAIKIGTLLHNTTDFEYRHWITPREAVQMASLGGAKGLGQGDRRGSLAVGQEADLVLYDLTSLSMLPRTDPIGLLVMGRPTQAVHSAWVRGRRVIEKGSVTTVDVDALKAELFARSDWLSTAEHASPTLASLEPQYRQAMGLG